MSEKKKKSCRWVKWILWTVLTLLLLVSVILLTLPLWIGPVVTSVANKKVPEMTQTGFHLGEFGLNPYSGTVHVGDLQLRNPERFFVKEKAEASTGALGLFKDAARAVADTAGNVLSSPVTNAVSLGAIDVRLSTTSLFSNRVHIDEIVVRDLSIYGDLTFSNIREIVANVTGDQKEEDEEPSETTVEIDRIFITGTRIQWGLLPISLPDIEIRDIGKDEPVTEEGAFDTVVEYVCKAADAAHTGVGTALQAAITGGKAVMKVLGDTVDLISDTASSVMGSVGLTTDEAGKTATAVTDAATATVGTVTEGIGKAAGAVTDGVGKAADAVSEKAGAAMDAVKGLFK